MYRHNGQLIAEYEDVYGLIEVVDIDGVRCLHFGSPAQQSCMSLAVPFRLGAVYEQAMTACLLFVPEPASALIIGLGGGGLAKFLLQHSEHGQLQVVELRPQVVEVAHTYFSLPQDSRLQISIGCGAQYVAQQSQHKTGSHELILVDAYAGDGMVPAVASEEFFSHCHNLLADNGMLVINLWRSDKPMLATVTRNLLKQFNGRVHFLPMHGSGNIIGFAFANEFEVLPSSQLEARAMQLQQRYQLDYLAYLQEIRFSDPMNSVFNDE